MVENKEKNSRRVRGDRREELHIFSAYPTLGYGADTSSNAKYRNTDDTD